MYEKIILLFIIINIPIVFFYKYLVNLINIYDYGDGIRKLQKRPIALIGGFMVLASSGFRVNSDLAQLSMITIAFAIIADFLFLPPLLMKLENLKNKNKQK